MGVVRDVDGESRYTYIELGLRDERVKPDVRREAVALLEARRRRRHRCDELIVDALLDEDPRVRDTHLATVVTAATRQPIHDTLGKGVDAQDTHRDPLDALLEVRVIEDECWALTPELNGHTLGV